MNKYPTFSKPTDAEQLSGKGLDATICSSLARHLSEQQDVAIRLAINNHLNREDWSLEEVKHRLALCSYQGSDLQTITMDGEPIMIIGPVETNTEERGRSTFLRATRGYKILNETNADVVAPPSLESKCGETEKLMGGCSPTACSTSFEFSSRECWRVWIEGKEWWVAKDDGELMEPLNLPAGTLQYSDLRGAQSGHNTGEES